VDQHFSDVGTMRLVLGQIEDDRHCPDDQTSVVFSDDDEALAASGALR
jgi:hypothetical protein